MSDKIIKNKLLINVLISCFALAWPLWPLSAVLESDNYVIFENVHHEFDGPVISAVACGGGVEKMTVSWTTDVLADAFVEYSQDSGLANSKEQGTSALAGTNHSVEVNGLTAGTYYYRVKSRRVNGGLSIDSSIRSCVAAAAPAEAPPAPSSAGGGGVIIIDKNDKIAPAITNFALTAKSADSLTFSWETDEPATSFIEYGLSNSYGETVGSWASNTKHQITVKNLTPASVYQARALSSDGSGNVGKSENLAAATAETGEESAIEEETRPETAETEDPAELVQRASARLTELLNQFSGQLSLNMVGDLVSLQYTTLSQLANLLPAPLLSGEPRVETSANSVVIYWSTNKETNSQVALAPETRYAPTTKEPYQMVVGSANTFVLDHEVRIFNLEPDTNYHYQIRSAPRVGQAAVSRDFIFRTRLSALEITSFFPQIIDQQTVTVKWVTNKEADSAITFAPYRGNELAVNESKTLKDNNLSVIHELTINELKEGVKYDLELISQDEAGNVAREIIARFATSEDDLPPQISRIQADATIFVDQQSRIQTIISWQTNEPATTKVYYQTGVTAGDLEEMESTESRPEYVKDHVALITKFKPGLVYSFRVESMDSGGNVSLSNVHTFMTPKQKESIFQLIMRILENTFGWLKR